MAGLLKFRGNEEHTMTDKQKLDKGFKELAEILNSVNNFSVQTGIKVRYVPRMGLVADIPLR